jgi:ribosome-binding ATPase YchF (GTP1/OBG family)
LKPCIYAANVSESDLKDQGEKNNHVSDLRKIAANEKADLILVSAQVESEIMQLDEGERKLFLEDLGISKSGLDSLIQATYEQLGLQTYFTTGKKETRAWTVLRGCTAPEAAAVIHSDFERGFIKCETVSFNDFVASNGYAGAKERGLWRLEGKEYIVQEGDVLLFKFNV